MFICFLVTSGRNSYTNSEILTISHELSKNQTKPILLTFIFFAVGLWRRVGLSPPQGCSIPVTWSAFVLFPHQKSCFTRRLSWQTTTPPFLVASASVPIPLPKLQVLPSLSTLLDLIPQVEAHLIVRSGYKSWQPSRYHT